MTQHVTLVAGPARVVVSPRHGAALVEFSLGAQAILRATPPEAMQSGDVARHACYPLVPYANRIAGGRLDFAGTSYRLPGHPLTPPHALHGLGWQRAWEVRDRDAASALLAFDHRPATPGSGAGHDDWPWPFASLLQIWLVAKPNSACLRLRLGLANTGSEPFPFGLGFHPFFPAGGSTEIAFQAAAVWETDAAVLPCRPVPADGKWSFATARSVGDTALDNPYAGWTGLARLRDRGTGTLTTLRADSAMRFLQVYAPPGEGFIALEPVTHLPDGFNRAARGAAGTGTRVIAPGRSFSCTMEISCSRS